MKTNWVIEFGEIEEKSQVGEKNWNLSSMKSKNYPIPHGFAITQRAFENFLTYNKIEEKITPLLNDIDYKDPSDIKRVSSRIKEIIEKSKIPQPIREDILKLRLELNPGPIMVRSSALGEDSGDNSFAGQLDSFITEGTDLEIEESLLKCWASFWNERALSYQHHKKVKLKGMGVAIQEMVRPQLAGVLFTRNPNHSSREEMILEFCFGHAEELVSGHITPGSLSINRKNKEIKVLSQPEQEKFKIKEIKGDENWISELIEIAFKLEAEYKVPLDIEWAVDENETVKIVQSRPITKLHDLKEETDKSSFNGKLIHWSNVNVSENYPKPITPLLYSIAQQSFFHYFRDLGKSFGVREARLIENNDNFKNIIGTHGARMYYNMTSIHSTIQIMPFGKKLSFYFNNFVGDPRSKTDGLVEKSNESFFDIILQVFEVLLVFLTTLLTFLLIPLKIRSLENEVDRFLKFCNETPGKLNLKSHLTKSYNGFLKIRFLSWKKASLADSLAMFAYGLLGTFLSKNVQNADSKKNSLLQGIPNLVSSEPPEKIWELAQKIKSSNELSELFKKDSDEIYQKIQTDQQYISFKTSLDRYLKKWGHRCSGELMLTEANFIEDPAKFIETLKTYLKSDIKSPKEIISQKTKERERIILVTINELQGEGLEQIFWPIKTIFFKLVLAATSQGIRYRERVRLKQALIYGSLRQTVLKLSHIMINEEILENEDDIFFLTYQEISRYLAGAEMLPQSLGKIAKERKIEHEKLSLLDPPDHFYLPEGVYYESNEEIILEKREDIKTGDKNTLIGLPACGGEKKGRVRLLNTALEVNKLTSGDILLTKQTDPGWATVFPLISALVIERGGMLSHGAIVAREFGIPAVVGIQNATALIKDETEILVDGNNGLVKLL